MEAQVNTEQHEIAYMLTQVPSLTLGQFNTAAKLAKERTIAEIAKPKRRTVTAEQDSKYPRWFNIGTIIGAVIMFIGLTAISVAKQLQAISTFIDPLVYTGYDFGRGILILSLTLISETGALLFEVVSGVLDNRRFTLAAWACAGVALIANIHVTLEHETAYEGISLYAWYVTILAPVMILALGSVLKNLAMDALRARNERKVKQAELDRQYEADLQSYRVTVQKIDEHPLYLKRYLPAAILNALRNAGAKDLLEQYPRVTPYAQDREIKRYSTEYVVPEALPALPPPMLQPPPQPALPAPSRSRVTAASRPRRHKTSRIGGKTCIYCGESFTGRNAYCSKGSCRQKALRARNKRGVTSQT